MPVFEQPWVIKFEIPQAVLDKTPKHSIEALMIDMITKAVPNEFFKQISEWVDANKKDEGLGTVFNTVMQVETAERATSASKEDAAH